MTTLYYHDGACSLAPHIILEWIGKPYTAKSVEFGSDELFAVNPAGAVPVLVEDDGWTLTQAGAIVHYLARKHPEAGLGGGDTVRDQAEVDRWSSFFTGDLHPAFFPVFSPNRYTTDESPAAQEKARDAGILLVKRRLEILNNHLEGKEWILGQKSVIDAYAFPMIRWAASKVPNGLNDYPNVKALFERMRADPAVQKVLADEAGK